MTLRQLLNGIARVIADEAERNPEFNERLRNAIGIGGDDTKSKQTKNSPPSPSASSQSAGSSKEYLNPAAGKRPSNRRPPAVLDPIHLARQGETSLRAQLQRLDLEQLRDIVADYGMDTGKLVMKWKDPERVIDRIVELAMARSQKGSAFRDQTDSDHSSEPDGPAEGPQEPPK